MASFDIPCRISVESELAHREAMNLQRAHIVLEDKSAPYVGWWGHGEVGLSAFTFSRSKQKEQRSNSSKSILLFFVLRISIAQPGLG